MDTASANALDIQIGREVNRAILSKDGDAALAALADFIRTHRIVISEDAWTFLEHAVRAQQRRAGQFRRQPSAP